MPVETFGYINSLNSSNPPASDGMVQGDDHLRGIKATLLATFPYITAAVTATAAQINAWASGLFAFAAGSAGAPSAYFVDTTLGFYRSASGVLSFVGGVLRGNGAMPVGAIVDFPHASIPTGWFRCNGQAISRTTYSELFALIGTGYGAGDGSTTFNIPNLESNGGLFRRSTSGAAGSVQGDTIKTHTVQSVSVSGANHAHGVTDPGHFHSSWDAPVKNGLEDRGGSNYQPASSGAGGNIWTGSTQSATTTSTTGISIQNSGVLGMTGTGDYAGGTETRPVNMQVVTCIKA